jgi:hypothetical protein
VTWIAEHLDRRSCRDVSKILAYLVSVALVERLVAEVDALELRNSKLFCAVTISGRADVVDNL